MVFPKLFLQSDACPTQIFVLNIEYVILYFMEQKPRLAKKNPRRYSFQEDVANDSDTV